MMTKITGLLTEVRDEEARIKIGAFEYQVLVPEQVRRQLQLMIDQEITLHVMEYLEGNQSSSRFIPRKLGFLREQDLDFFELLCTVEKVGVKKALKAMARSSKDIADAITRQDSKWLTTLPGVGPAMAEQMVTTLKRKVASFTAGPSSPTESEVSATPVKKGRGKSANSDEPAPVESGPSGQLIEEVYLALMGLGLGPAEARDKLDIVLRSGENFTNLQEAITIIFRKG